MIIQHDIFVCRPGQASRVAKLFKEMMGANPDFSMVMTDMTGQFHRVIMVSQFADWAAYSKAVEAMQNPTPEMKEASKKMEGFNDMYVSGSREVYRTW